MSQVSVETTSPLGRKLTICIPLEKVRSTLDDRLNKATREIRLDGFSSKKPLKKAVQDQVKKMVEQKFGKQIRSEILQELVEKSFSSALETEKLRIVGRPQIDGLENSMTTLASEDLTYTASFDVFPEVTLKPFGDFKVNRLAVTIEARDVEKTIKNMKNQYADWDVVERSAEATDRLKVDFNRSIEGEKPDIQKDTYIILGSDGMLPGLDDALIGKMPSEDVIELDLQYPDTWTDESVAGKKVHLSIVLHEVSEKRLLEDTVFFDRLGGNIADLSDLQEKVKKSLEVELDRKIFSEVKESVLEELLSLHRDIDLPQSLIDQEIKNLHRTLEREQEKEHEHVHGAHCTHEHHESDTEHDCAAHQKEAIDRVALGLLINAIIQEKKLDLDHAKVRTEIQKMAARFGGSPEVMKLYYQNEQFLGQIQHQVLVDQAVLAILNEATIIDKPSTFDEVMQLQ